MTPSSIRVALPLPIQPAQSLDESEPNDTRLCTFESNRDTAALAERASLARRTQTFRYFDLVFKGGHEIVPSHQLTYLPFDTFDLRSNDFDAALLKNPGAELIHFCLSEKRIVDVFLRYCRGQKRIQAELNNEDLISLYGLGKDLRDEDLKMQALAQLDEPPEDRNFLLNELIERGRLDRLHPSLENFLTLHQPHFDRSPDASNPVGAAALYFQSSYSKNSQDRLDLTIRAGSSPFALSIQAHYFLDRYLMIKNQEDRDQAFEKASQAHREGSLFGTYMLAEVYQATAIPLLAFQHMEEAAKKGCFLAEAWLSYYCRHGIGTEKNPAQAFQWLKAAEKHRALDLSDMIFLGNDYEHGIGTKKDPVQAVFYYRKVADAGGPKGISHLGRCYELGIGVEIDLNQAYKLYERSAQKNHLDGLLGLGRCLEEGIGTNPDPQSAVSYYQAAITATDAITRPDIQAEASYRLAQCFRQGIGIPKDLHEARACIESCIVSGGRQLKAVFALGTIREEQNQKEAAVTLYQEAAQAGHSEAAYRLGLCQLKGEGTPQNLAEAFQHLQKAATGGIPAAWIDLALGFYEPGCNVMGLRPDPFKATDCYKTALKTLNLSKADEARATKALALLDAKLFTRASSSTLNQ